MAHVLLVEDSDEVRGLLSALLTHAGHTVEEAPSADIALPLIDQLDTIEALVTDVRMPGSMDGIGLGTYFRKRHADLPILYVTGSPDLVRDIPMRPNREIVLAKPFALGALVDVLEKVLAR